MTERKSLESERAEEDRIDRLRLAAFKSNDASDRQSYFDAASKWFQDRHYRRLAAQDQKPVAWQWRYVGDTNWKTPLGGRYPPKQPEHLRQIEARPLFASPPPAAGWDSAALPDHGGADAVVKAQIATLAQRFWTIHPRELQDKGMTREDFYIREMTALVAAVAANASAEARLREALEKTSRALEEIKAIVWGECPSLLNEDSGGNARLDMDIDDALEAAQKALSTHPHASGCDKQGEAKCPECGGSGSIEIDDGHFIKCKCAATIRSADCDKQGER